MAGIEEVGAALGFVQIGLGLIQALHTYVGDYKESRSSIVKLAEELKTTLLHVEDLRSLVSTKKTAKLLDHKGQNLANNCMTNCEHLIQKLTKLLVKARLPNNPTAIVNIVPEDIIVSRLSKAYWPLYKPQVETVRRELDSVRIEIILARSCIDARAQSERRLTVHSPDGESIVALAKRLQVATIALSEARAEEVKCSVALESAVLLENDPMNESGAAVPQMTRGDSVNLNGQQTMRPIDNASADQEIVPATGHSSFADIDDPGSSTLAAQSKPPDNDASQEGAMQAIAQEGDSQRAFPDPRPFTEARSPDLERKEWPGSQMQDFIARSHGEDEHKISTQLSDINTGISKSALLMTNFSEMHSNRVSTRDSNMHDVRGQLQRNQEYVRSATQVYFR